MVLVDTNVLLDVFTDDLTWRDLTVALGVPLARNSYGASSWRRWSEEAIRHALVSDSAAINPIIYAEA